MRLFCHREQGFENRRALHSARRLAICRWLVLACLGISGCAGGVFNRADNAPLPSGADPGMGGPVDIFGEHAIALSFSGGGLRASAFAHGVLTALQSAKTADGDLLDDLTYISGVSGGALTAAHYGVYGRDGLARFRDEVLLRDFERGMRLSVLYPQNLARVLAGGLNQHRNFGATLDAEVFRGATFADIYRHPKPDIRIHATDLYHRVTFPFIPRVFSLMCSDLRSYPVAEAVAASMAVPLVFAPVVVRTYPDRCADPPLFANLVAIRADPSAPRLAKATAIGMGAYRARRTQYIKLIDGGLSDNFGVSSLLISRAILGTPYAPMSERDAVVLRRLLFIVVDASAGPSGDWLQQEDGPSGIDMALGATNAAVDASARMAVDGLGHMIGDWQDSVIRFRCALTAADRARLAVPADWNCADVKFSLAYLSIDQLPQPYRASIEAVPTRLTLAREQIDTTIEGGRIGTLALSHVLEFLQERTRRSPDQ